MSSTMDSTPVESETPFIPPEASPYILEKRQRLSRSVLWQLQRSFFEQQGVAAWSQGIVPSYITSNPYIADAYARVVFAWLRDLSGGTAEGAAAAFDSSQPIYLVELGAGAGRFAYHFLRRFFALLEASFLKDVPIVYVLTDFSERTLEFWQAHSQLQSWFEAGRLDVARFDGETGQALALLHRGETLAAGTLKNPLGVIANYFFDGLTQDVFYVEEGELYESLLTLTAPIPEPNLHDPEMFKKVVITYEQRRTRCEYYDDPAFNALLRFYQSAFTRTGVIFPIGPLHCLRALCALAGDRLLLLSADKGYHLLEEMEAQAMPIFTIHGSVSLMVNYHALGMYIQGRGGEFLNVPYISAHLDIAALVLDAQRREYPETRLAYRQAIEAANPEDFYAIRAAVDRHFETWNRSQLLAYLRFSGWDSSIFLDLSSQLLTQLEDLSDRGREEWLQAAKQVWANYYCIGEGYGVPFALGVLCFKLGYYTEGTEFFERALQQEAEEAATYFNLGMCHYGTGNLELALEFINRAMEADPFLEVAREMRVKLLLELRSQLN